MFCRFALVTIRIPSPSMSIESNIKQSGDIIGTDRCKLVRWMFMHLKKNYVYWKIYEPLMSYISRKSLWVRTAVNFTPKNTHNGLSLWVLHCNTQELQLGQTPHGQRLLRCYRSICPCDWLCERVLRFMGLWAIFVYFSTGFWPSLTKTLRL